MDELRISAGAYGNVGFHRGRDRPGGAGGATERPQYRRGAIAQRDRYIASQQRMPAPSSVTQRGDDGSRPRQLKSRLRSR